ncbi:ABC transporter permease [Anoxybacter fermentans]|uniref:ABC transporter permease n=1 Tax=Anoxybacter fermentans TaxID=1323375 RepID=A0A3S9SYL3_9FIRM|nr:sugar ABC transporter permease [Anoxybacter fermentans]AZR73252.1 ABC transporter permease [Anoxybacter fermentans]
MAKYSKLRRRENLLGYLFILPWILGFLIFTVFPMGYSIWLSFTKWNLFTPPRWVGFDNYVKLLTEDPKFWQSLKVTTIYSIFSIPLGILGSLSVALLLNQKFKGVYIFRTIYYLPAVVSGVAVSLLWKWIFSPDFGLINFVLSKFGITGPGWLSDPAWTLPAYIIMSLWGVGGGMVIYLAGLNDIPVQLYEAAEIDGANRWQKFIKITLPMLSPVIFFNLIMGIIGAFQTFTQAYIMGGAGNAGLFYVLYLFQNAFSDFKMGYASAQAWILFLIILVLTLLVFKSSDAWVFYQGAFNENKKGGKKE